MIGRALRGPEFGGSENANIVSFIDDWKQKINWAEWDPLDESLTPEDEDFKQLKHPPWQIISIDLIRHISQLMYKNDNIEFEPFLKSVPIGWYQTNFFALTNPDEHSDNKDSEEKDDYTPVSRLLMVFENEKDSYEMLMDELKKTDIEQFAEEEVIIDEHIELVQKWQDKFFEEKEAIGVDFNENIFYVACHMAQNFKEKPKFFLFKEREFHDMDIIAKDYMELNYYEADDRLRFEYNRKDRYWKTIYPNYELFKQQYDACVNRILNIKKGTRTN